MSVALVIATYSSRLSSSRSERPGGMGIMPSSFGARFGAVPINSFAAARMLLPHRRLIVRV